MDERVRGVTGSGDSAGRRRRRALRAIGRGYRIAVRRRWSAAAALGAGLWLIGLAPALAESGSRYSAPLWTWIAAIVVSAALSIVGLAIGYWFLRKRARVESSD